MSLNGCVSDRWMHFETKWSVRPKYKSVTVPGRSDVVFGVQACSDAVITLASLPGNARVAGYLLIIGADDNSVTFLRRDNQQSPQVEHVSTPGILSCDETRFFWVSWREGRIKLGRGLHKDNDVIINWMDPMPRNVVEVFFDSRSSTVPALWQLSNLNGKNHCFCNIYYALYKLPSYMYRLDLNYIVTIISNHVC